MIDDHGRCEWVNVSFGTDSPRLSWTKFREPKTNCVCACGLKCASLLPSITGSTSKRIHIDLSDENDKESKLANRRKTLFANSITLRSSTCDHVITIVVVLLSLFHCTQFHLECTISIVVTIIILMLCRGPRIHSHLFIQRSVLVLQ